MLLSFPVEMEVKVIVVGCVGLPDCEGSQRQEKTSLSKSIGGNVEEVNGGVGGEEGEDGLIYFADELRLLSSPSFVCSCFPKFFFVLPYQFIGVKMFRWFP